MPRIDLSKVSPAGFPSAEDDAWEFKSSETPRNELKKKLEKATSGFANSGGGCFVYGVGDNGNADGGVEPAGRQDICDWVDQVVDRVIPKPPYSVKAFDDCEGRGQLSQGRSIIAVSIHPSEGGPYQAPDKRYYIRAGAHTCPATHHIVEALWSRRHMRKPAIRHVVRSKPQTHGILQVGIVAVTDAPALDVEFSLTPLLGILTNLKKHFPIRLPVVDRNNPFFIDVTLTHTVEKELADDVVVDVSYRDLMGNKHSYVSDTPLCRASAPLTIGKEATEKIAESLDKIEKKLRP